MKKKAKKIILVIVLVITVLLIFIVADEIRAGKNIREDFFENIEESSKQMDELSHKLKSEWKDCTENTSCEINEWYNEFTHKLDNLFIYNDLNSLNSLITTEYNVLKNHSHFINTDGVKEMYANYVSYYDFVTNPNCNYITFSEKSSTLSNNLSTSIKVYK